MMTPLNILLLLSLVVATAAWSSFPIPSKPTTPTTPTPAASTRRSFLFGTTIVATSILTRATPASATYTAAALTPDTALQQWKDSVKTIDNLCDNWDTISKGGGDSIRKELGTANFGTSPSPLFQIDKAFKVLRDNPDVDLIELTEQAEELSNALAAADSMAYSSNFAGGAGKPTPPAVYIERAKKRSPGDATHCQILVRCAVALEQQIRTVFHLPVLGRLVRASQPLRRTQALQLIFLAMNETTTATNYGYQWKNLPSAILLPHIHFHLVGLKYTNV
mmetsp:Transcript_9368/g.16641  ORF Transcript_9368/g.16641 Transcript_9368/m.16641 type:complete len:278 (-) Transcript_9368:35-868(-)